MAALLFLVLFVLLSFFSLSLTPAWGAGRAVNVQRQVASVVVVLRATKLGLVV